MEAARVVLDFVQAIIWPSLLLIGILLSRRSITRLVDRATKITIKAPGFEGQVDAATRNLERHIAAAAQSLTAPPSYRRATETKKLEDHRAAAARTTDDVRSDDFDEAIRRKAVEQLLTDGATWGWQMAQLGWHRLPTPDIRWDPNGQPTIAPPRDHG